VPSDTRDVHVLVVGAGYAGIRAAVAAHRDGARVTLVDATGNHEFSTRLAAVAGGRSSVGDGWAPIEALVDLPVERATVVEVDAAGPAALLDDGRTISADAVVVAAGARTSWPAVPGLDDHAHGLRTVADALAIRGALIEADRLIVVGGGATGVQLAAEAARRHRHLAVTLIEAQERLLPEMATSIGVRAEQLLRRRGVEVRRRTPVSRVDASGVVLDSGKRIDGLVVWATGFEADGSALLPNTDTRDGRLVVDNHLRVPGSVAVFAAGDIAAHTDLFNQPLPMSAQVAVRAGAVAGRNAVRVARGLPPSPAILFDLGRVVQMGPASGVGRVLGFNLAGPLLDRTIPVLHDVVDIRHLFQTGGISAVLRHGPGRHHPTRADERRVERPQLRSVS
jgi:NADH:ubiquinone reductase (H+-translocating)